MKVRFYMSDDGEVLSNKEYPVTNPILLIPVVGNPIPANAVTEEFIRDFRVQAKVYRSYTVTFPYLKGEEAGS